MPTFRNVDPDRITQRSPNTWTSTPAGNTPGGAPATPFLSIDQAKTEEKTYQLAQATPTTAVKLDLYTPSTGVTTIVESIWVAWGTLTADLTIQIYHDDDGNVQAGSLIFSQFVSFTNAANPDSTIIEVNAAMSNPAGTLMVYVTSGAGEEPTFTLYGKEIYPRKT